MLLRGAFAGSGMAEQLYTHREWLWNFVDEQGVEPTKDIAERLALYEQVRQTPPGPRQEELMKQVLQRAADAFEIMGITTAMTGQGIVNVDMRNVPEEMPNGFIYLTPQPTLPATYWFDR